MDDRVAPDPISKWQAAAVASVENRLATISTLMACMSTDRSNIELLAVIADLARRFSAAVIGVWARQLSTHSSIMAIGLDEPRGHEPDKFRESAAAFEAQFRTALSTVSNLRWRAQMTAGPTSQYVADEARAADLVVAAVEPGERIFSSSSEIDIADLLMRGRRPILMAPIGAAGLKLPRTLVCWKASREAQAAVADALPILRASQAVDVIELVSDHEIEPARSRCLATPLSGVESADLAAIANDLKADLIVAGTFGHSRLREWVFGGVTRDLLVRAERCTLVSH